MRLLLTLAADLVVAIHLLWILFLVFGAIPGARWAWARWLHLAALGFSVLLQLFGWVCPVTHLEVWLRHASGTPSYEGTFIGHYLERIVYASFPPTLLLAGTFIVLAVSLWIYFGRKAVK